MVAWYGAIVATLAFLFNVFKWTLESARLKIRIVPTIYHDGGFAKVEKTPQGGEVHTPHLYYHVEVINVGERAATILGVQGTTKKLGIVERIWPPKANFRGTMGGGIFAAHHQKHLPHVISPGEVWSCRVLYEQIENLRQAGNPKLEVTATCWRKPRLIPFPDVESERIVIAS